MANFDDLIFNLTGRLVHQNDFAFQSKNGEIANQLRATLSRSQVPGLGAKHMDIDSDGDISVQTDKGTIYLTANSIFLTGWQTTPRELSQGEHLQELSAIIGLMFEARRPLEALSHQARLFFTARFNPLRARVGASALTPRCYDATLRSILCTDVPEEVSEFRTFSTFQRAEFTDSVEVETSKRDIQVRYGREASVENFPSFESFLKGADLKGVAYSLKPFISDIISDPSKLFGRIFKEAQSVK
jgi:hypothetical protein